MLNFILGSSGTGKTEYVNNILTDLSEKGEDKLLIIVFDRISFETEKTFLELLGPMQCRNVQVLGFSRMCSYVFSKTGNTPENVIDDGARSIIMSMALDEIEDSLNIFSKSNNRKSVLDLMTQALNECKRDNISTSMLRDASKSVGNDTLCSKLEETALALDAYDALISNTYIDPLDDLNRLKSILTESNIFKDYTIVIDSYNRFSCQELDIIEILMKDSKDFYVTLNLDYQRRHNEVFSTTYKTYKILKQIAVDNGITVAPDIILNENYRFNNDELKFLERNIYKASPNQYSEKTDNIEIFTAADIYGEVDYVARRIKKLISQDGYRYNEIAVVSRDETKYTGVLDTAFEKYDIPYYMNIPEDIFTRPVIRFVSCAIDFVIYGFGKDDLLNMLKTGLTQIDDEQIYNFENYLFTWNIDGKNLTKEFRENPSGFNAVKQGDNDTLQELEGLRKYIMSPLVEFAKSCKNATAREISTALYNLLEKFDIKKSVNEMFNTDDETLLDYAKQEVRVYNMLMQSLDKIVAIAGDKHLTLKKYKEYLDLKISDLSVSDIPRFVDRVSVSTADIVRLNKIRAVFVIGAIDGEFPGVPTAAGVFTENERRLLINNNLPLSNSLEELTCHEKYLAYCTLTSASDKLFVSTYASDFSANVYNPSSIITQLLNIFPKASALNYSEYDEFSELFGENQAFECLARNYCENDGEVNALKLYFSSTDKYRDKLENIENALENKPFKINDKDTVEKLYSDGLYISASQLEVYSSCAFQYFCKYAVGAKERRKASIDPLQFGNIVHYFLESFLAKNNKQVLNKLSDSEIKASIDEILSDYAQENLGGLDDKTESFLNLYNRLKKNIFNLIKQIIRQLAYSDFVPVDFELRIGKGCEIEPYNVKLKNGHSISLRGFIDRVDVLDKNNEEKYVRVIDYKTGNKDFKISEILYGLNLQMLIYLHALVENGEKYYGKKLIPTGVLYMPGFTVDLSGDRFKSDEEITDEMDKKFRMNGLVLNDKQVLEHMDRQQKHIKIPKKVEDGMFSDGVASSEQFNCIFRHIDITLQKMGEQLYEGNAEANPIKGVADGCQYCPYDSVCAFSRNGKYRYAVNLKPKEVYQKLGMEADEDEQC